MKVDPLVLASYEKFLLYQYQIKSEGLYYSDGSYYIYCPDINELTKSADGTNIHKWFERNKIMTVRISAVSVLPDQAIKIDPNEQQARIAPSGYLITGSDVQREIDILVPSIFPDYHVSASITGVVVSFQEEVSAEGIEELQRIFSEAGFQLPVRFQYLKMEPAKDAGHGIVPKRVRDLKSSLPKKVVEAMEMDQDHWADNRKTLLSQSVDRAGTFKSESFRPSKLRCLINCEMGGQDNIRNYLSLYEEIGIVAPRKKDMDVLLKQLDVSKGELAELVSLGKVQLIYPGPIESYDTDFLSDALERNAELVHFPRSIKTMVLGEMKSRNPLYYPAANLEERRVLLSAIDEYVESLIEDKALKMLIKRKLSELGHGWASAASFVNQMGVNQLSHFGIVDILGDIMSDRLKHENVKLGFMAAAPSVDIAAAIGAIVIPHDSLVQQSTMIANLYSGTPEADWVIQKPVESNFIAQELLTVGEHVPVLEFATTFSGNEITRFHKLVLSISKHQERPEDMECTIEAYNYFVKQYEKRPKFLNLWDISGFVLSGAAKLSGIPLPKWIVSAALKKVQNQSSSVMGLGTIIDKLEAGIIGSIPDAVLVSRMRTKLKAKI